MENTYVIGTTFTKAQLFFLWCHNKIFDELNSLKFWCNFFFSRSFYWNYFFIFKNLKTSPGAFCIQLQFSWRKSVHAQEQQVKSAVGNKVETNSIHEICCAHYGKYTKLLLPVHFMIYSVECVCYLCSAHIIVVLFFTYFFLINASGSFFPILFCEFTKKWIIFVVILTYFYSFIVKSLITFFFNFVNTEENYVSK